MSSIWMHGGPCVPPSLSWFRRDFEYAEECDAAWEFSGDEQVELFLDGELIGVAPETDLPERWHWNTWSGRVPAGRHRLLARVIDFGEELRPYTHSSVACGFYFRDRAGLLNDGWEFNRSAGIAFATPFPDWGGPPRIRLSRAFDWPVSAGNGSGWRPVSYRKDCRSLHPPEVPPFIGGEVGHYTRSEEAGRTVIRFAEYLCVRPEYRFEGPGSIRIRWAETAYRDDRFDPLLLKGDKGNRDGSHWVGNGDEFTLPAGEVSWIDPGWRAGRLVEINCREGARLLGVRFRRAGYPYRWRYTFHSSSPELNRLLPLARRTLERCSHDIYMDCPYYERMMYVGDAKIEMLSGYVGATDTALPEKCLNLFARSAGPDGMIRSRCPSKAPQTIPAFASIYITMLHDFAMWRDRPETVRRCLPAARKILACFERHTGHDGLPRVDGWHFIDWVDGWRNGTPPGSEKDGTNSAEAAFHILALMKAAELEEAFGDRSLSFQYRRQAAETRQALYRHYYDPGRGLLADDLSRSSFSEHPQLILSLAFDEPGLISAMRRDGTLSRTGIYFTHYYFEACHKYRLEREFRERLSGWHGLESQGLTTVPEEFVHPRSDCHAWSAHPMFHFFATQLGIRPAGFGGRCFKVAPLAGIAERLEGRIATPHGDIEVTVTDGLPRIGGSHPRVHVAGATVQAMRSRA